MFVVYSPNIVYRSEYIQAIFINIMVIIYILCSNNKETIAVLKKCNLK